MTNEGREEKGVRLYAAGRVEVKDDNTFLVADGGNTYEVFRSDFADQFATCDCDCDGPFTDDCQHVYSAWLFFEVLMRGERHNPVPEKYQHILEEASEAPAPAAPTLF